MEETFENIAVILYGACILIVGVFPFVTAMASLVYWLIVKNEEFVRKSAPSDDTVQEMKNILEIIQTRNDVVVGVLSKKQSKKLEELKLSSELASLIRYAHFAGYNLTYEQDDESNNPADFKTDLRRAAVEHRNNERQRYL